MRSIRCAVRRSFTTLHRRPLPVPTSQRLPQNEPVDEEICPGYNSKKFYPARPGDVLNDHYQILVKVGWGVSSTTWFARDMRGHPRYQWEPEGVVALKITNADSQTGARERDIEDHIAKADPSHRGCALFRAYLDSFEICSPEGERHLCFAYEPMREPVWIFQRRFKDGVIPLPLIKTYVRVLLIGLDYLHKSCSIVHTDLKLDNIMVTFEDPVVLNEFMDSQLNTAMQYKTDLSSRPVYRCCNDFGPLRKVRNIPKIVDFGLSTRLPCQNDRGIYPIQPDHYRAPEVILGCGWSTSTDIWNFGVLLWDMIQGRELFQHIHNTQGHYAAKSHLAEMIGFLGPPPRELVEKARSMSGQQWPEPIKVEDDEICASAMEYFGGPFFDGDGMKTRIAPRAINIIDKPNQGISCMTI
ncbi:protein kinase [Histoplasma capsulatum var. duboisii H88]|uniref:non-specific serine/threonine protein kinase n=1 Tax=Ajellomyces capsulatus (strain H88) TaxID=544711 RepID=F0UHY9_AJEC8|nr:protein kinase [Histoplasma capsulatum var. duboisii H88]